MRELNRRLFNLAAAVSLVLCVATVALWVRSYWGSAQYGWTWQARSRARSAEIYAVAGSIGLAFIHSIDHRPNYNGAPDVFETGWTFWAAHDGGRPYFPENGERNWGGYGFWLDLGDDTPGWRFQMNVRIIEVPAWSLATAFVFLPAIVLIRWYRCHRQPGLCTRCGYDLRATPERCPECGTAVPQPQKAGNA
jgi:hypothetical protein